MVNQELEQLIRNTTRFIAIWLLIANHIFPENPILLAKFDCKSQYQLVNVSELKETFKAKERGLKNQHKIAICLPWVRYNCCVCE